MKHRGGDHDRSIHRIALDALDPDALREVLEQAGGEDCEKEAVHALRQVLADVLVSFTFGSVDRARRRAREVTAEDVATVADGHDGCCCSCGGRGDREEIYTTVSRYTKIDN